MDYVDFAGRSSSKIKLVISSDEQMFVVDGVTVKNASER